MFTAVDRFGVIGDGMYARSHNPNIYVDGLRREQFNSSRIVRRRRDLERFDADDLALIRYGYALDFSGRIHGHHSDMSIPTVVPSEWTVFWIAAWSKDEYRWTGGDHDLDRLMHGAWHFESHGGSRHLGYKFGGAWATRHTGERLEQIRQHLQSRWGSSLIEQPVKIVRWTDGASIYTEEVRRECPALGCRVLTIEYPDGSKGIYL